MHLHYLLPLTACILASPSLAQISIDGSINGDNYGAPAAVQAVETQFGDNLSELNAAYTAFENGRFILAITGNLEDNFNKLEIFLDSKPGGENVFSGVPGNDNTGVMVGTTFDAGFEADYHIIVRRGSFGGDKFDLDIAELGTANFSEHFDVFGGSTVGSGLTGTGPGNSVPIEVAYDNSNLAGIFGGTGPADQTAAAAVETGLELAVGLADIGNPVSNFKICAFVNGSNHDFGSNQFLGAFVPPQGNLGGDGTGAFTGTFLVDLNNFAGDQFFLVPTGGLGTNFCLSTANSTGSPATISATGNVSVAANDLTLSALPVPAQPGIFFYGPAQVQILFGNGFRCVGGQVVRLPVVTPVAGVSTYAVDLPTQGILPGTTNFQYWYRDPLGGNAFFNLSDGIEIVFIP